MNRRALVPFATTALAALTIAACGGGSGDEDAIAEAIEAVATTKDPSNCTKLETQRFVEQNNQQQGKAAIGTCKEVTKAGQARAESATVSNISVNGSKATAEAALEGGPLDSQTLEFALVEEGGIWKLDQIEGFVHYDGKALGAAFKTRFEEEAEGLSRKQRECIVDEVGKASESQAEALFFSGSPEAIVALAERCAIPVRQRIS